MTHPPFKFCLVREPIVNRVFHCNNTRFKVKTISITSRCYSGMVAVDGKYRWVTSTGVVLVW